MAHVHYDLEQTERGIRSMYDAAPDEAIHHVPAVAAAFRRPVDVEIALTRWNLNEIMNGTPPEIAVEALSCILVNLIMNRARAYNTGPGEPMFIDVFMPNLIDGVAFAVEAEQARGTARSEHSIPINPVMSGKA